MHFDTDRKLVLLAACPEGVPRDRKNTCEKALAVKRFARSRIHKFHRPRLLDFSAIAKNETTRTWQNINEKKFTLINPLKNNNHHGAAMGNDAWQIHCQI